MAPDFLGPMRPPARGRRLLTLVHISDLHFGYPCAEDGASPPADWRRHIKTFDGLLGHHFAALDHLTQFVKLLKLSEPSPAPLIVLTGDLTACGRAEEFERASRFVTSAYEIDGNVLGLKEADVFTRTIPGNHDHWPGTGEIRGPKSEAFKKLFDAPMKMFELTLASGHQFQLFGINSDADVRPDGWDRTMARGCFESEVNRLDRGGAIPAPSGKQIRALLVHHSPVHFSLTGALEIDRRSQRALNAWLRKSGVSVILTGHIHGARGHVTRVQDRDTKWDLLEARCGTTTQLDRVPADWKARGTWNSDRLPLNSLIVHRVIQYGLEIQWEVEFFERLHDGFRSRQRLPGLERRSIVVWPKTVSA